MARQGAIDLDGLDTCRRKFIEDRQGNCPYFRHGDYLAVDHHTLPKAKPLAM